MKYFAIFLTVIVFSIHNIPAFACSKTADLRFFLPWNEYISADCSAVTGTLSWTGMLYIMLALIIPTVIVIRKKNLSKKFYFCVPATVLFVMVFYSAFIYGTPDITQFAVPRGIHGGINYDVVAWRDTETDFTRLLAEKNIIYSKENMDTKYDYTNGINSGNIEYQIIMPANYCGFAISDDAKEYWYTATFDKTITSSELHEENPYDCSSESKECVCGMQERIKERFLENKN